MSDKQPEQKRVKFSDFDREVLARLPLTMSQREALIKSMSQGNLESPLVVDREVSVEVVSKPSIRSTSHVDM